MSKPAESGPCVRCGQTTSVQLGNVFICQPCYEVRSSCCPEFGPDDLTNDVWSEPEKALHQFADPTRAPSLQRFFKTGSGGYAEGDMFLGIPVPITRKLAKDFTDLPLNEVRDLLRSTFHEQRLLALLILVRRYQKGDEKEQAAVYRLYTGSMIWINNWDLIDVTAEHIVGAQLYPRDRAPLHRWAAARAVWPRRIAIMSTFYFIKRETYRDTLQLAERLMSDKHDLIHKATGWMLREIGNRNKAVEVDFLNRHAAHMPRTMLRYAIEKFPEEERQYYLQAGKKKTT